MKQKGNSNPLWCYQGYRRIYRTLLEGSLAMLTWCILYGLVLGTALMIMDGGYWVKINVHDQNMNPVDSFSCYHFAVLVSLLYSVPSCSEGPMPLQSNLISWWRFQRRRRGTCNKIICQWNGECSPSRRKSKVIWLRPTRHLWGLTPQLGFLFLFH